MERPRGFVLPVVVVVILILSVFLFAYNQLVRNQNNQAHRGAIGEVTSFMAHNGIYFLADCLQNADSKISQQLQDLAGDLFTPADIHSLEIATGTCSASGAPADASKLLDQIAGDYQKCLLGFEWGGEKPVVKGLGVAFKDVYKLRTVTAEDFKVGVDTVEKRGTICFSCIVSYRGSIRMALTSRQFRIVSMVPGPYCRFTLFNHFCPATGSYNVVRNFHDGSFDDTTAGGPSPRPLILYNGTDSIPFAPMKIPDQFAREDLQDRGWVYLGQSPEGGSGRALTALKGPIELNIPSGYSPDPRTTPPRSADLLSPDAAGGHGYLSIWTKSANNTMVAKPIDVPATWTDPEFSFKSGLQGFFTKNTSQPDDQLKEGIKSVAEVLLLPEVSSADCRSSWILPYGDSLGWSRTLVAGNAWARFLQKFVITEKRTDGSNSALVVFADTWRPNVLVTTFPMLRISGTYWAVFRDLPNLQTVVPAFKRVAFNMLFDLMSWGRAAQPNFDTSTSQAPAPNGIGDLPPGSFENPGLRKLNNASGILSINDFQLWAYRPPLEHIPGTVDDTTLMRGSLTDLRFQGPEGGPAYELGLEPRVTHFVDLRGIKNESQIKDILGSQVFSRTYTGDTVTGFELNKSGIFLLLRDKTDGDITLDLPITLSRPGILILERGDLVIKGKIVDPKPLPDGTPTQLFSLIALDGNIKVPGNAEVQAYLVALRDSLSSQPGAGGRILCTTAGNANRLFVRGGVACFEMAPDAQTAGRSTMDQFKGGGVIRYNPFFNPSGENYAKSYALVLQDCNSAVEIRGAE